MPVTLRSRLPEITAAIPIEVGAAIENGKRRIATEAASQAPVRTGELASSIEAGPQGVYADWYYRFAEFGTRREPARPFLIPAAEREKDGIVAEVEAVLRGL